MAIDSHAEILRLRTALRDLVALSTIPVAWVGREPPAIAAGLADVLVGSLYLDFAFVRLCDPRGGAAVEVTRGNAWKAFPEWLERHLAAVGQFSRKEIIPDVSGGAGPCRGIVMPIGVNAEGGLVAAACDRTDFPTESDQLLLSVAANHAVTAFQNARLIHERRRAEQALRKSEHELRQARDELEMKVAEQTAELRRSEAYLAEAQRLSHTGSWSWNPATGEVIHWSEEQSRLFGFDPEEGVPSAEEQTRRFHPEDHDRVLEAVDRAIRERTDFAVDLRVVLPNGTMKYVHGVGHPVFNASGDLVEYIGTMMDVTERKRAEEERERLLAREQAARAEAVAAQQRFADLVNSVEGIVWEADTETFVFSFVSEQAQRILGYPTERWLNEPTFWKDHLHPDDRDRAIDVCLHATAEKRDYDFECRMIAADGKSVWLRDIVTVVVEGDRATKLRGVMVDITKRKRAEEALREQADLLNLTHDSVFVRDRNDVITYWNRGAQELYGWRVEEAVGQMSHQLMQTIFPEPLAEINAELLGTGRWEGELVHTKRDGTQVVVASRWSLERDEAGNAVAVLETNNDITERKRAEEELRESERRYRHIFQGAGVSIWEEDFSQVKAAIDELKAQGVRDFRQYTAAHPAFVRQAVRMVKIVDVNDATVKLFGAQSKDELLISLDKVCLPETEEVFAAELIAIAEGRTSFESETIVQTLKGDRLAILLTITFPPQPARLDSVLVSIMDITERKRAEEALRRAQAELAHVTRVTTLGELATSIAHEINQPLAAIVTNGSAGLRWLAGTVPNLDDAREALQCIIDDGQRASEVITRIRALLRKTATEKTWLDLSQLVHEVMRLTQPECVRQGVTLRVEVATALPPVWGDRVQVQQVLLNLVLNALEAMAGVAQGPRALVIRARPEAAGTVLVAVEDTGMGIAPEQLDAIFTAFYTTKAQGLGMGLAISRTIIEQHGGRLWAVPHAGPGATVQFTLRTEPEEGEG